ncbi:hypothetical protein K7472_28240 [Streptomyces sp. PTM05]|uniref:EamA/RhaT family transporter n=1 Tax=Streptantibioticus parmotrematis TaxID=2873249 RepID=A0ABS7R2B7_9ACTN|nr:hypothetical protein [Streptantibioticus parmotrematis]MBY8888705.1 hypothetical protein [Streptantibioticus parmotrematis]
MSETPPQPDEAQPTGAPAPEPLRFFSTTWVDHDGGYAARRAGLGTGALVAAAVGAFLIRFAYQGFDDANVGGFVELLFVVAVAVCTALAFGHTWSGFQRRSQSSRADSRGLLFIGFIGTLIAYALRCLTEAPGEGLHRAEYEAARTAYERKAKARRASGKRKRK